MGDWEPIKQLWAELAVQPLPDGQRRCAQPPYDRLPLARGDIPAGIILSREATHFIREDDIPIVEFSDASGRPLTIKIENEAGQKEEHRVTGRAVALPLIQGGMLGFYDSLCQGFAGGSGHSIKWRSIDWPDKYAAPQYLVGAPTAMLTDSNMRSTRLTYRLPDARFR